MQRFAIQSELSVWLLRKRKQGSAGLSLMGELNIINLVDSIITSAKLSVSVSQSSEQRRHECVRARERPSWMRVYKLRCPLRSLYKQR